ncbi:MAG: GNAT family N-acetyltransferase [Lachnospiraceae bacterium]|nr:GNAT family N-acetyltransferase [Lachnospiraceae bacterium]
MIQTVRIGRENEKAFLSVVDNYSLAVCDILIGAVETDTGEACGVIAAESVNNKDLGYSIAVRFLFVAEKFRRIGVASSLVTALVDISGETGAAAVTCCHYEPLDEFSDVRAFFAAIECKQTVESLPVYGFRLLDITPAEVKKEYVCGPLEKLPDDMWRSFVRTAAHRGEIINVKSYYEPNCSLLVYDWDKSFLGAILISRRIGVLFVDHIIVTGKDKSKVLETLMYNALNQALKYYTPGTEVGIIPANNQWEMTLEDITDYKTEKIGEITEYVLK